MNWQRGAIDFAEVMCILIFVCAAFRCSRDNLVLLISSMSNNSSACGKQKPHGLANPPVGVKYRESVSTQRSVSKESRRPSADAANYVTDARDADGEPPSQDVNSNNSSACGKQKPHGLASLPIKNVAGMLSGAFRSYREIQKRKKRAKAMQKERNATYRRAGEGSEHVYDSENEI